METFKSVVTSDDEETEQQEPDPPNLETVLDQFREEWQQEITKTKPKSINPSKFVSIEERAASLFLQGTQAEQNGELYVAIAFYKKAIQLVPDIESKIDFRKMRVRQDSECSVESVDSRNDDEEDLLQHLQNLSLHSQALCNPKLEQNSTHISELPAEVMVYILKWVVSSELDIRSLEMISQVCQGFYICARDDELWRLICLKIWGQNCGKLKKYGSWRKMYIERPHLLFNGCYISKSTYYRSGEKSLDGFYRPYHIVQYFRYIRMFPDGTILMVCNPEEPQITIPRLRTRSAKTTGLLKGHYRISGNKVSAELGRAKLSENQSGTFYKYKRRPVNNTNQVDLLYYIEFEVSSSGKGIHNILTWKKYTITTCYRSSNQESVSDVELSRSTFPPMVFSRVKSYSSLSESPL